MTNLQIRHNLAKKLDILDENDSVNLYDICLCLIASSIGSSDPLLPDLEKKYIKYLNCVIDTWIETKSKFSLGRAKDAFDNAIKNMILETLYIVTMSETK